MQPNNIQLAVFDMAGTTVHDEYFVTQALLKALTAHGYDKVTLEAGNAVMGIAKPVAIGMLLREFYPGADEHADIAAIHASFLEIMIHFYKTTPGIREIAGATDTFRQLRDMDIKIGLDTGFSRDITDIIIQRLGWDEPGILDVTIASDEVAQGRPYPDMIYKAMEQLHIDSAKSVAKIGDTPVDLQEGANAGCGLVIGVWSGVASRETLEQYPHTHLVPSVTDVPGKIREHLLAAV